MRITRRLAALSVSSLSLASIVAAGLAGEARAAEVEIGGKPLEIDVTNTAIGNYHFNNRNYANQTASFKVDDDYAEFLDRFNLQLSYWRFSLGVRVDSYVAERPSEAKIASLVAQDVPASDPRGQLDLTQRYLEELNSRFLTTVYPTKLFASYQQPGVEVTLGDFYVQLGRGLVFSVRKIDELSIDTTVRGAKVAADRSFGPVRLAALAFAGEMNPLRIDETTGRRLNVLGNDPLFFGFPTANALDYTTFNQFGTAIANEQTARPNYIEDRVVGGKLEGGSKLFTLAANAAVVIRKDYDKQNAACVAAGKDERGTSTAVIKGICQADAPSFDLQNDPGRQHNQIRNFSGSIQAPNLADHGDLYVEVAGQQLADGRLVAGGAPVPNRSGIAAYVAASARGGPLTLSLEGKHYRSFFAIPANIDLTTPGFAANEFSNIAYSQPPTAQSIYIEPVSGSAPNLCVTGGRALTTYRFTPTASVFTWLGRFASWSEIKADNYDCDTHLPKVDSTTGKATGQGQNLETDTWDYAAGVELFFENRKSKVNAYVGALDISSVDRLDVGSAHGFTFYREGYLRYDLVKHIAGPFSIQAQGWHRRRYEPTFLNTSWWEGENYTALQWSPHFSAVFGFEYLLKDGCEAGSPLGSADNPAEAGKYGKSKNSCLFFNGGAQWRSAGSGGVAGKIFDTVNVFVGDRRGALRCVSGVCRVFPPFSGGKIELVSRF